MLQFAICLELEPRKHGYQVSCKTEGSEPLQFSMALPGEVV